MKMVRYSSPQYVSIVFGSRKNKNVPGSEYWEIIKRHHKASYLEGIKDARACSIELEIKHARR